MVSKDKEFEYVTSQIIKHIERSVDAFKMFIQLFSAIVGGAIWLSSQPTVTAESSKAYLNLSNVLMLLVTLIASVMVFENYRVWWGYRIAQSTLVPHVRKPRWTGVTTGVVMIVCMVAGCILFWRFNPFSLIHPK
jgi:succinate dehydrogenase hydrophobic anchor subunit